MSGAKTRYRKGDLMMQDKNITSNKNKYDFKSINHSTDYFSF